MPCPFFLPLQRASLASLPHPERLSLGSAYSGRCTAADILPDETQLHDCNLGYADCAHLPADRAADAVRFCIKSDPAGPIAISYVLEMGHAPIGHGTVTHDTATGAWRERHPDARIQRMAECCLESFRKER